MCDPLLAGRRLQVIHLVAQGLTCGQIARRLFITENTVKTHLRRVYEMLDARNAPHAVALLFASGRLPLAEGDASTL